MTAPILAHPDFTKPFILYTDASRIGVEAVLCQRQQNRLHPISYFSQKLNKQQVNYSITDLEGLAVALAARKYHHYLDSAPCKLITDHSALKYILSADDIPKGRRGRWMVELMQYRLTIEH